ncbi:MAG: class I SAM-dependent methyltransferase [Myxococcota bacterium]
MATAASLQLVRDPRARGVLERLHGEAEAQTPRMLWHYLPKLPRILMGGRVGFDTSQAGGFYADKYLALERAQAAFLYQLALTMKARRVVEFGTSFGVSTIWLAAAVRENGGGQVIGTEIVPEKAERARANVAEAGLESYVDIRTGDARAQLEDVAPGVDFLLNDGFPMLALEILQLVEPKFRDGALVVTDNVGMFRADYADYLAYVRGDGRYASASVPFKSGTELSVWRP